MVAKGDKQAPSLSSKQGQGRRRFSAVKQLTKELSYYKARQLVALGEFANNDYYQLVEQADNLRWLRDLRKQKRAQFPNDKDFTANFDLKDFDRAWGRFHQEMGQFANALMKLDARPFRQAARAIEAFKEIRADGGPHVLHRYALDFAQEHGQYPADEKNSANPKFTFREFKARFEDWILKQRQGNAALKVWNTDKQPQPSTRLALNERVLRRIVKEDLGIPLKPDKVGRRSSR